MHNATSDVIHDGGIDKSCISADERAARHPLAESRSIASHQRVSEDRACVYSGRAARYGDIVDKHTLDNVNVTVDTDRAAGLLRFVLAECDGCSREAGPLCAHRATERCAVAREDGMLNFKLGIW